MDSEGRTIPGCTFSACLPMLPMLTSYQSITSNGSSRKKCGRASTLSHLLQNSLHPQVTGPMSQLYANATPPTYEEVLDLDRRLRQFVEMAPFSHYKGSTFLAYVRTTMIPLFSGNCACSPSPATAYAKYSEARTTSDAIHAPRLLRAGIEGQPA